MDLPRNARVEVISKSPLRLKLETLIAQELLHSEIRSQPRVTGPDETRIACYTESTGAVTDTHHAKLFALLVLADDQ